MSNVLLMPFLDDSESFVHGFECGKLWEKLSQGEILDKSICHVVNKEQIVLMCQSFGLTAVFDILDDTWMYVSVKSVVS